MDISFINVKFVLIFFRVLSILWLVPLLSSRSVSMMFKAGFSLIVSLAVFEYVPFEAPEYRSISLLEVIFKEILLGLSISFIIRLIFSSVYAAGEVLALQTGLGFARFMDPTMMAQVSVIESFKNLLAVIIFLTIDAHHILIRGLVRTFDEIPLGIFKVNSNMFGLLAELTGRVFVLSLKIGAPVIVVLLIVELMLGLLARMVPQMNIFMEGLPLKILITFVVLSFSLSFTVPYIGKVFFGMERDLSRLIRMM
ncbi:MAG: flagellar biosynthetic protein FliR [Deltaproteobacteria bacterium]|nr:flagellar biosynthetic protein FliR [Deltaproteobacteria bacterium]